MRLDTLSIPIVVDGDVGWAQRWEFGTIQPVIKVELIVIALWR
jgi:hypothetical protein